jgi:hypothetical protein
MYCALQAEANLTACSDAFWAAVKQPARQRPSAEEWFAGPYAPRLRAIQNLALNNASPADTALAAETLQVRNRPQPVRGSQYGVLARP